MYGVYYEFQLPTDKTNKTKPEEGVRQGKGSVSTKSDDTEKMIQLKGFASKQSRGKKASSWIHERNLIYGGNC